MLKKLTSWKFSTNVLTLLVKESSESLIKQMHQLSRSCKAVIYEKCMHSYCTVMILFNLGYWKSVSKICQDSSYAHYSSVRDRRLHIILSKTLSNKNRVYKWNSSQDNGMRASLATCSNFEEKTGWEHCSHDVQITLVIQMQTWVMHYQYLHRGFT